MASENTGPDFEARKHSEEPRHEVKLLAVFSVTTALNSAELARQIRYAAQETLWRVGTDPKIEVVEPHRLQHVREEALALAAACVTTWGRREVAALLHARGFTVPELAENIGVRSTSVKDWLYGDRRTLPNHTQQRRLDESLASAGTRSLISFAAKITAESEETAPAEAPRETDMD